MATRAATVAACILLPLFQMRAANTQRCRDGRSSKLVLQPQIVANNFMERQCVESFMQQFPDLLSYFNQTTLSRNSVKAIRQLVTDVWTLGDLIEQRSAKYNFIKRKFARHFSSTISKWADERDAKLEELTKLGFPYEAAQHYCHKRLNIAIPLKPTWNGNGDKTRACVLEWARKIGGKELEDIVSIRMNAEKYNKVFRIGPNWWARHIIEYRSKRDYRRVQATIKNATREMDMNRLYLKELARCQRETKQQVKDELTFIHEQLVNPTIDEDRGCSEEKGRLCPEGTSPSKRRSFDFIKGSKIASISYVLADIVAFLLGAIVGGFVGAHAGLAGCFFGLITGGFLAYFGPINEVIAVAALKWFSIGPEECACFPRNCHFDERTGACAVDEPFDQPSKNPFARALPYQGMKCGMDKKNPNVCELKPCTAEDFVAKVRHDLYGKVGKRGKEIFNCLSKNGLPSGALSVESTLPNGHKNTVEARNELLTKLGIRPVKDDPSWHVVAPSRNSLAWVLSGASSILIALIGVFAGSGATLVLLRYRRGILIIGQESMLDTK